MSVEADNGADASLSTAVDAVRARFRSKYARDPCDQEDTTSRGASVARAGRRGTKGDVFFRAIGVDFGRQRTGVAVSTGGMSPRPLEVLQTGGWRAGGWKKTAQRIVEIAVQEAADGIVVGIPVTSEGSIKDKKTDSEQGRFCRYFAREVATAASEAGLRVVLANEACTSAGAVDALAASGRRRYSSLDDVAAAVLLENYYASNGEETVAVKPPRAPWGARPRPPSRGQARGTSPT